MNQPITYKLQPLDSRIPRWDFDDLTVRDCPFCSTHNEGPSYIRPDGLTVRKCNNCNTWYVSPSPSEKQIKQFYGNYQESHGRVHLSSPLKIAALYDSISPMSDIRLLELGSLMKFEGAKVLDIGFGKCQFLYMLRRLGAIPYGFELDKNAIELARSFNITVFEDENNLFSSKLKFDLISLLDLVEHPLNPMDLLRRSSDLLNPGGLLLIWTPNGDFASVDSNLTTFRVDLEHMQYFSPSTCLYAAAELKIRIAHLEGLGFPQLEGIKKPKGSKSSGKNKVKEICKSFPGFFELNRLRHRLFRKSQDPRSGSYHLFCIMKKPDASQGLV